MKNYTQVLFVIASLFSAITFSSCKKDNATPRSVEQLVVGNWEINRIQLRVYNGTTFVKDTILRQNPNPKNYVNFDANGAFAYKFNANPTDIGTYTLLGSNQINTTTSPNSYQWKILTITEELLTVMNTTNSEPLYPGYTVERYQTFIR